MGKVCPSWITADQLGETEASQDQIDGYFVDLQIGFVVVCTGILFGWYRRLKKPTFVILMWLLFVAYAVSFLAQSVL